VARATKRAAVEAEPVEGLWDLPEGWRWERLQDIAEVNPRTDTGLAAGDQVTFLPMAAIAEETGRVDTSNKRSFAEVAKGYTKFRTDDILFAKITPCMENGKIAVVPTLEGGFGAGSTEFHVIRSEVMEPRYLFHYLVQRDVRQNAQNHMSGSAGQLRVPTDYLRLLPVPVPPADVQRQIVSRIDELFAEIDDGERALHEVRQGGETYRQTLLKAAVTGDLTATWRQTNPPQESGQQLLGRLLTERRAAWAANSHNRNRKYSEPPGPEIDGLPTLPAGWCWASLQQLTFVSGGVTVDAKRKPNNPAEVPYLRVANVQRGSLDLSVLKTIKIDRDGLASLRLEPGDILLNEGGDRDKVGRGWVWNGEVEDCVHQNHVFKARPANSVIKPELVSIYLNELGRRFFIDESKQTTNLASISMSKVARAPVAVPPGPEGQAILERLRSLQGMVDQVVIDQQAAAATALRQSIFAAAFRGDLVA